MQQSDLPVGSGDEESPADLAARGDRAAVLRMELAYTRMMGRARKRRHKYSDYTYNNCEEAWGNRP